MKENSVRYKFTACLLAELINLTSCIPQQERVLSAPTLPPVPEQPTPTPTLTSTLIPTEIPTQAPESTRTPEPPNFEAIDALMKPFVDEAMNQRTLRAEKDPEFFKRIDKELNKGKVNFLLFGYGETHEPPATEKAIIGSYTIISYDTSKRTADIVSLTHDIRAPEVEIALKNKGQKQSIQRIDRAYFVGGLNLMQKTLEDATGLSMDFQMAFKDESIKKLIDEVFGGIEIDIPQDFRVQPFYFNDNKYPEGHFAKGMQRLNGLQVLQFIKTVPVSEGYYGKGLEHNARKHLIFKAILETFFKNVKDMPFWVKMTGFASVQLVSGSTSVSGFEPQLAIGSIHNAPSILKKSSAKDIEGLINKTFYIVDPCCGDGGVRWAEGLPGVQVPFDSNANGDLITEYWPSVRELVKKSLLSLN